MPDAEWAERLAVVREAQTWLRTAYHHAARVKGAGVDCATLLIEVFSAVGKIERFEPDFYPPDWHLHRDAERYLEHVYAHARELRDDERPLPADVVIVKYGRAFSHGAIVIDWPLVIHAYVGSKVVYADFSVDDVFRDVSGLRPHRFFSLWGLR